MNARALASAHLRALAIAGSSVLALLGLSATPVLTQVPPPHAAGATIEEHERLRVVRRDIATLKNGIQTLAGTEQGLLGELKGLEAEVLKRQGELAEVQSRVAGAESEAAVSEARAKDLAAQLESMRAPVARRIRALYRLGPPRYFRVLLASAQASGVLAAYRAAAALSEHDAALIRNFRAQSDRSKGEAARLAALRLRLAAQHDERGRAADATLSALERKRALLGSIRSDRQSHQAALSEMEAAERTMGGALARLRPPGGTGTGAGQISFERFRGLLDWPSAGEVSARFGRITNPRFGTSLEHSGLDIDAPFGAPVRAVQDGIVVFSQWFRGYGLTAIVDHGGGWLSVYAHASALLVEKGDQVRRGQKIAAVGDSGSLRGAYLYFEIRKDGRPVDPLGWLRPL